MFAAEIHICRWLNSKISVYMLWLSLIIDEEI